MTEKALRLQGAAWDACKVTDSDGKSVQSGPKRAEKPPRGVTLYGFRAGGDAADREGAEVRVAEGGEGRGAPIGGAPSGVAGVTRRHESLDHGASPVHHHHSHGASSRHGGGHHLLTVEDLTVSFRMYDEGAAPAAARGRLRRYLAAPQREVEVLHGLSVSVHEGEIVAVVGASGSGKTLLADAVMGLFEPNALVRGRIWFDGAPMDAASLAAERGRGIALVPQSVASLDPLMQVGRQVEGAPRGRGAARRADAARRRARRRELFARYGLSEDVARLFPHELSGGMARRVLLCCALMGDPKLIIADEPTPGLDLPLAQAALADLRAFADGGGGVMLITHDIELALTVADRVAVFRDGTVVEETAVESFAAPEHLTHPFSRALWHALPEHDFAAPEAAAEDAARGTVRSAEAGEGEAAVEGAGEVRGADFAAPEGGRPC